jgi:hypothetical protein
LAAKSLEQRVDINEQANQNLQREVTRLRDVLEIQKIVGLMQHYHTANRNEKESNLPYISEPKPYETFDPKTMY